MGLTLLHGSPTFKASLEACAAVLAPLGLDLLAEYGSDAGWKNPTMAAVGLISMQIALVDLLRVEYGIVSAGMLGHSAGQHTAVASACQDAKACGITRLLQLASSAYDGVLL